MKRLVLALVCAMAATACGGGDPDPAAPECHAFLDLLCDRAVECAPEEGTHSECLDTLEGQLPGGCDEADVVGTTYNDCMLELQDVACSDIPTTLQTTCDRAILFEQ